MSLWEMNHLYIALPDLCRVFASDGQDVHVYHQGGAQQQAGEAYQVLRDTRRAMDVNVNPQWLSCSTRVSSKSYTDPIYPIV